MNRRLWCITVVLGCFLMAVSAAAQVDYPEDLKKVVAQYPGSQVEMAMKTQQGSHVVLSTQDSSEKVYAYYKQALSQAGWQVQMEMNHKDGVQGHWQKDDKTVHVVVTKDSEKTQIVVLLGAM
ncbi:MAG: hypothetical protein WHS46_12550 [Desulfosoma sp.]